MNRAVAPFVAGLIGGLLVSAAWLSATRANHMEIAVGVLGGFLLATAVFGPRR